MDDQMRALVCLKSALILYFEKNEARSNRACIHKNLKNFRLLAIAAFFLKKHYKNYPTTLGVIFFYAGYLECLITAVEGV